MRENMQRSLQKIFPIFFLLTLLTFPLGQVLRLQLPRDINVSLFDTTVLLSGMLWFVYASMGGSEYKKDKFTKPILIFFLTVLLSLFANLFRYPLSEFLTAALYAIRWILFASMYFLVMDLPMKWRERIPQLLCISGGCLVLLGYLQYFLYGNLRNLYYLGWDEHMFRMFSAFLDPNFFGVYLVLFFMFLVGQIHRNRHNKSLGLYSYSFLSFVTFIAIFLTTSRTALIMLSVSLITFLVITGRKRLIIIFLAILAGIFLLASPFFYVENVNPFRVASSLARVESANNALEIIVQNPVFGVGFNAYRYAQIAYGFRSSNTEFPSHADSGTDNSLLFVFATTGVVGFIAYIYLLYTIIGKNKGLVTSPILVASVSGLFVSSFFINSLFYPAIMYWLFVLLSLRDYT